MSEDALGVGTDRALPPSAASLDPAFELADRPAPASGQAPSPVNAVREDVQPPATGLDSSGFPEGQSLHAGRSTADVIADHAALGPASEPLLS